MPESAVKVLAANADQSGKAKTALAVNTQTWAAEVIKPTMPAGGSTTYRITEATINFGKVAGQTGTGAYNVEIRNIDASGKPLANGAPNAVIDRVVVSAASLATVAAGAQPPRVTLTFTGSVQIPRANGFAICVCPQAGAPNGVVGMQAGGTQNPTTMTYCTSANAGAAWGTPATDRDFLVEIKGTITMARDTSAELDLAWHLDDGAATLSNVTFSPSTWYAQTFKIDWPTVAPGATPLTFWLNSISVRIGKTTGAANVVLHIRRVNLATGKPKAPDLDSVTILSADVPTIATATTQPPWVTANFTGAYELAADETIAVCISEQTTGGTYYIGCETGGTNESPSDQASVKNNAGSGNDAFWQTPSTTLDVLFKVTGQYSNIAGLVKPPLDSATTLTIASGAGSTSHSFSVTIGDNGNDAGCLWACSAEGGDVNLQPSVCSGMTFNGVPGMEILYTGMSGQRDHVKWFRWLKPPIGTFNLVATYPDTNHRGAIVALSYFDINQSQPEGGNVVYFPNGFSAPAYQTVALIGDINLVGLAWSTFGSGTAAAPVGNTTTLGGSETGPAGTGEGAVVGYSTGDVQTGYQLSGASTTPYSALGIIGILSTTGVHSQFAPPPPDYSQYPKQLLRTVADPDIHNDPDDGI